MKKLTALFLALTLCLGCFAACGTPADEPAEDNDDEEKTFDYTTEPTTDSATDPTADPTTNPTTNPTEDDPAEKIVVVGYTIFEPMNYKDADGKLVGFDTELAEAVFAKLGYKVVFQEIKWESKYTDLNSGAIDCVWNGFEDNLVDPDGIARTDKVDFSYNYVENCQVVVVEKNSGITTAADLKEKKGAAEAGSVCEWYASSFDGAVIGGYVAQSECFTAVMAGVCDFAVVDAQLAKSYCGKGDYANLQIVEELSSDATYYAIGFKKGSALTAEVNQALEELAADGTIAALAEKYGMTGTVITDFTDQKK